MSSLHPLVSVVVLLVGLLISPYLLWGETGRAPVHTSDTRRHTQPVVAVDASGVPGMDPTRNVLDLVRAESRRQDDLRQAESRYNEAARLYIEQIMVERQRHIKEVSDLRDDQQKELRLADVERINSIRQIDREEVSKIAASSNLAIVVAENRRTTDNADFTKRLSALELTISAGGGKAEGIGISWGVIVGVLGLIFGFVILYRGLRNGPTKKE